MKLTDRRIKSLKPKETSYKAFDGRGLYILIKPSGSKLWKMKYRFEGKEKTLSFGPYPETSLSEARERSLAARKQLGTGLDPSAEQKRQAKETEAQSTTFEHLAREWMTKHLRDKSPRHAETVVQRLEKNIFPYLGHLPVSDISPALLLETLRHIEKRGALSVAHRVRGICGQIFNYALITGLVDRNPATDLSGALTPTHETHYPTFTAPHQIGELMRAIGDYDGNIISRSALKLAPLVFVRPGELRRAEWSEISFDTAEWRIPASKMKTRNEHIVPLSRQALGVLKEIHQLTGHGRYVFPSLRSNDRPMSDGTVNAALRRLGYSKEEFTGHSFRSMASTRLNEMGWLPDAIERQLAHTERNKVRAAYNRAEHLDVRRNMMQAWADYLDEVKRSFPST